MPHSPKVLAFDIETLPVVCTTFYLRQANIRQESIIENTVIFCASWQIVDQLGEPQTGIKAVSILDDPQRFKRNIYDDYYVVKEIHKVLSDADVYLYQNGDAFDLKHFNARCVYHKLPPVPSKQSIDTLKQARKYFRFDSNKLDFMGRFLGAGEKMDTGGMELWDNIVQLKYPPVGKKPDPELALSSIKYAIKYNKQDVRLLVRVFKELRKHIKLPNFSLYLGKVVACTHCGAQNFTKYGLRYTQAKRYQRYFCNACERPFDPPRTQGKYIDAEFKE